jgi:hypothetical protein
VYVHTVTLLLHYQGATIAGYKAYSHNQALKGCRKLLGSMSSAGSVPSGGAGTPAFQAAPSSISATDSSKEQSEGSRPGVNLQGNSTEGSSSGRTRQPAPVQLMSDEELAELVQTQPRCVPCHCVYSARRDNKWEVAGRSIR